MVDLAKVKQESPAGSPRLCTGWGGVSFSLSQVHLQNSRGLCRSRIYCYRMKRNQGNSPCKGGLVSPLNCKPDAGRDARHEFCRHFIKDTQHFHHPNQRKQSRARRGLDPMERQWYNFDPPKFHSWNHPRTLMGLRRRLLAHVAAVAIACPRHDLDS